MPERRAVLESVHRLGKPASTPVEADDHEAAESRRRTSYLLPVLAKRLSSLSQPQLLDLGPLRGANIEFFAGLGCRVIVEDLFNRLETAPPAFATGSGGPERRPLAEIRLDYPEASFDAVITWGLFDFLTPVEASNLVSELHRIVKPGGIIMAYLTSRARAPLETLRHCQIVNSEQIDCVPVGTTGPLRHVHSTRDIERMFVPFKIQELYFLKEGIREILFRKGEQDVSPSMNPVSEHAARNEWNIVADGSVPREERLEAFARLLFNPVPGWWSPGGRTVGLSEYARMVARLEARNVLGSEALDYGFLADEALMVLFDKATEVTSPRSFFRQLVRNKAMELRRQAGAAFEALELPNALAVPDPSVGPEDRINSHRDLRRRALSIAIKRFLTPALREVASLYFLRGLTYEEIATELNISSPTARQRVCRARKRLSARKDDVQGILRLHGRR